jgi:hypothetical protein
LWVLLAGHIGLVLAREWTSGTPMSGATMPALTLGAWAVVLTALLARGLTSSIAMRNTCGEVCRLPAAS